MVAHSYNPRYSGSRVEGSRSEANPGKNPEILPEK
jgi:hypothetical protein